MNGKRGAPAGNQNAKTHGFYSKALSEAERLELEEAVGVEGIDAEIALLRIKLMRVLEKEPENIKLIMQAMDMIAKLLKASETMTQQQKEKVKQEMGNTTVMPFGFNNNKVNVGLNR